MKNVLEAFPKLKFVGPHLGGWSVWEEAAKVLPKYDNIIVDTSSSLYELDPDVITIRPFEELPLLEGPFRHADPFAVESGIIVGTDLPVVRCNEYIVGLSAHRH